MQHLCIASLHGEWGVVTVAVAGVAAMEMVVAVRMVKAEVLTRWKCRMPNTK